MRRDLGQLSVADGLVKQRAGGNDRLGAIGKIIDWSAVGCVLSKIYSSDEGRPSYPVLSLVKLLLFSNGPVCPIPVSRRRWMTGCRSGALPACRWTGGCPIARRSGGSARNWGGSACPRRCSAKSAANSMPGD